MYHSLTIHQKAISLRKLGYSLSEISERLNIAKSTSSVWLSSIVLNKAAQKRLAERRIIGLNKAKITKRKKRNKVLQDHYTQAIELLKSIEFNENLTKLLCSILFWAEGEKSDSHITFVNSDPNMIKTFLALLRKSYEVDNAKLRALLHLHDYHNEVELKYFWSTNTKIPETQFYKSYLKPHTGKNIKPGYQGCISIRYYDHKNALELRSIYNVLASILTGVG